MDINIEKIADIRDKIRKKQNKKSGLPRFAAAFFDAKLL